MRIKFKKSNAPYMLISLLFSLILFFNVNSQSFSRLISSETNYEEALQNVPINVLYDSDEYFVHGFSSTVSVKLSGANRIQLNREVDPDTRNFSVVADLTKLSTGTHEVRLKTKNLSSSLFATIEPETISVTIEKKVTKQFDVSPILSSTTNNTGLEIGQMSVEPTKVSITTGEDTMKEIDRVVASVDSSKLTADQKSVRTSVQALNASGESLPIQSDPQNVTINLEIQTPSKEVSLYPIQEGELPSTIESVKITLNRSKATITGAESVIDQIDSIGIPVDVSQIQGTVKKLVDIPVAGNYQVNPKTVNAQVTPVFKKSQETETSSTDQSNASTEASKNLSEASSSAETSTTQTTSDQEAATDQSTN
ncbi:CdaR family protein [Enterococcus xiangfangensis]|uniref:CdaR family protein n=1 Tax=Enterococcus xiangfangensis TaxID=1296537 RepID=A0ABU3FBR4_9ENTE|nr:CdaR family protein [Enterococcus xiangfangensis]MDT2760110.1 CdaR family protein [Enterococcus xiangfangensis]